MDHPQIIQGGMGVAVSNWRLARTVSRLDELGVVSGTLTAVILARRLQEGDPEGDARRALEHFPVGEVAARVIDRYYVPGGKAPGAPYKGVPMPTLQASAALVELTVAANFVEVFLAKEGHDGRVGINLLEKIQLPTVPSLYGALLAGVDYVLMGAGIPRAIPGVLDRLATGDVAELKIDVSGAPADREFCVRFDPREFFQGEAPKLRRPYFLPIVSSATLAITLARKSSGRVDGFVVEGEAAGGHNAPPRGGLQLSATGEPVYGPRDAPDIEKIRSLGLPFWLAGAQATPGKLAEALSLGASGIQVGTAFAFSEESGFTSETKRKVMETSRSGTTRIFTDPAASPTGFPFKVVDVEGTLSDPALYAERERVCDLGYLREPYWRPEGFVGYRCAAEPEGDYVAKGGTAADTKGRKCLCNGLTATVGLAQVREDGAERSVVTAGTDVVRIFDFAVQQAGSYSAADVIRYLRGGSPVKSSESDFTSPC